MKKLLLPCAVFLLAFLTSCVSEHCWDYPNNGTGTGNYSTISLSLRIVEQPETRGESLPIAGETFAFNTGDLFLVAQTGIIVRHYTIRDVPANDLPNRIISRNLLNSGVILDAAPGNTRRVYIVGNTQGSPTTGNIATVINRTLDAASQYDARNANIFGSAPLQNYNAAATVLRTAEIELTPTVARIELGEIRAASDIASFRLEGIFVNNFYRWATVDGTAQNTVVHSVITNWAEAQRFTQGSALFPIALEPAVFDWYNNNGILATPPAGANPLRVSPTGNNVWAYQVFAQEENSTTVPHLVIRLRDIVLQDGRMLPNPQFLIVELYENESPFNRLTGINAGCVYRVPAVVFGVGDLLAYDPEMPPATPNPTTWVTAFTNMMYDFQNQQLHTNIDIDGTTAPIAFQWQVSGDNVTFSNIDLPGASGTLFASSGTIRYANWILPANFIHQSAQFVPNADGNLYFRTVKMTNYGLVTQSSANTLQIHFVRTTQTGNNDFLPGFGIDTSVNPHVRYAIMSRSANLTGANTTLRVALLNLGATETDGIGLGYLFQWGRRADGHQVVDWNINPATRANRFTNTNTAARSTATFDAVTGQPTSALHQTRFITGHTNWSIDNVNQWGRNSRSPNFTHARGGVTEAMSGPFLPVAPPTPASLEDWDNPTNNPCPTGWRVPSIFDILDMNRGCGTSESTSQTPNAENPTRNNIMSNDWYRRPANNNVAGGAIVRNILPDFAGANHGATVLIPAAGFRGTGGAPDSTSGSQGGFWSSSHFTSDNGDIARQAMRLWLGTTPGNINPTAAGTRAVGAPVRCVAD